MTKKILVFTEMAFQGSGYYYLMHPLLERLALAYDVKIIGLGYNGEEHWYNFSIVGCRTVSDGVGMINNLHALWKPDLIIVGLDIPHQLAIHDSIRPLNMKYLAITPMENPPLTQSWAAGLMEMDYVFFISDMAKTAAMKAGLTKCDHLPVGVDYETYRPPSPEERSAFREVLGATPDTFIILTVADNQERKNLWAAMSATARLKQLSPEADIKHIIVTREHSPVGYKLRDLAMSLGINKEVSIHERGMSRETLWKLYAAADVFLITSKAEGLGLPSLEAMSCGTPVVATKTGAYEETLADGRGYLIDGAYEFIDVFGNSKRTMIDIEKTAQLLHTLLMVGANEEVTTRARNYIVSRSVDYAAWKLENVVKEITDDAK